MVIKLVKTTKTAYLNDVSIVLRDVEFDLLCYLFMNIDRVVSYAEIINVVFNQAAGAKKTTISHYVYVLNKKLLNSISEIKISSICKCGYYIDMYPHYDLFIT